MHGLIIFSVIATAFAAPQYNYQSGADAPSQANHALHGAHGGQHGHQQQNRPVIYNKQYFIHSAPDDALDANSADQSSLINKKNLRIVFIRTPENKGLENAALQLAKAAGEDKTAIYVLNKQTDLAELQNKLSQISDQNANKPEVHFVKYRTPEEAEHAQRTIQNQYDQLQGPSSISNEGIAPVSSVVGALGQSPLASAYDHTAAQNARTQNDYLPPSK